MLLWGVCSFIVRYERGMDMVENTDEMDKALAQLVIRLMLVVFAFIGSVVLLVLAALVFLRAVDNELDRVGAPDPVEVVEPF